LVQQLAERVSALPGISAAGFKNPLLGGAQTGFLVEGRPKPEPHQMPSVDFARVTPGAMEALGIRLLQGRYFDSGDNEKSTKVVILDETMSQQIWPGEDPTGKHVVIMLGPEPHDGKIPWMTVVGVARHVKNYGVDQPSRFEAYVPNAQFPGMGGDLVLRSHQDPARLVSAVRQVMHTLDPNLPVYDVRTLRAVSEETVTPRKLSVLLLGLFSGIALVLGALGIYGVMSYVVTGRTHEIGLRMALGAEPRDVNRLLMRQGARIAVAGVAAGLLASLVLTHLLRSMLLGVRVTDPFVFAGVAVLLSGIALLACYFPARAAMALDPVVALRYE
jgi:putative ABC transport system permease protein